MGDIVLCSAEPRGGRPLVAPRWTGDALTTPGGGGLVDVAAAHTPVREVVASIARQTGQRIDVRGELGRLDLDLRRVPWRAALDVVVSSVAGAELIEEDDGALVVRARPDNRLRASGAPAREWLQLLASLAEVDVVLAPAGDEEVTLDLNDTDPLRAIEVTAQALGWRVERRGDLVRVVGESRASRARPSGGGALRLQATVLGGERRRAIISGRSYAPGDVIVDPEDRLIEGLRLEAVRFDSVTLRRDGVAEVLELPPG